MKIVLDTNVILSALITHGLSSRVLDICIDYHEIFISKHIIAEVLDKLRNKFKTNEKEIIKVNNFIKNAFKTIIPKTSKITICRDDDDNRVIELAEYVKADYIITGDKDLLEINNYKGIKIIKSRDFMERYSK